MAAKIVVEAIVYSLVYSVFMLGLFKVQGQGSSFIIIRRQFRNVQLREELRHRKR